MVPIATIWLQVKVTGEAIVAYGLLCLVGEMVITEMVIHPRMGEQRLTVLTTRKED